MLGQCLISWRGSVEIVGIPSSVHEKPKLNCNIVKIILKNCHRLKDDHVIVTFSKRTDCEQILSVRNDLKNINIADFAFEGNGLIYINQRLCSFYKML